MEDIIADIKKCKNEFYRELIKEFGSVDTRDPQTTFKILTYCKNMSDIAMEDYNKTNSESSGIRIIAITDICKKLCSSIK